MDRSFQWVVIIAAAALTVGGFVALALGTNSGPLVATDDDPDAAPSVTTSIAPTSTTVTTVTTTPPSTSTTVRPATGADGFPDASTTGPVSTELDEREPEKVEEEGAVIENVEINGQLTIAADDVTIRNARINTDGIYGILVDDVDGITIEDVEIIGDGIDCSAGIAPYGTWTAHRIDVSNCEDGVKMAGGQELHDSYVHDLAIGDTTHNDAVQITNGEGSVISGNRLIAPVQNAAIMLSSNFGPVAGWTISDNWFEGGTYTVYVRNQGHGDPEAITLRDNHWQPDSWLFGPYDIDGDGVTLEGNEGI